MEAPGSPFNEENGEICWAADDIVVNKCHNWPSLITFLFDWLSKNIITHLRNHRASPLHSTNNSDGKVLERPTQTSQFATPTQRPAHVLAMTTHMPGGSDAPQYSCRAQQMCTSSRSLRSNGVWALQNMLHNRSNAPWVDEFCVGHQQKIKTSWRIGKISAAGWRPKHVRKHDHNLNSSIDGRQYFKRFHSLCVHLCNHSISGTKCISHWRQKTHVQPTRTWLQKRIVIMWLCPLWIIFL